MIGQRVIIALSILLVLFTVSALFAQSEPDQPQRYCPACGTPNRADARFCKNCGAALPPLPEKVQTRQQPASVQPTEGESQMPAQQQMESATALEGNLDSLSREDLIRILKRIDQSRVSEGDVPVLPKESIAYMTEDELRSMVRQIVKQEFDQRKIAAKSDPIGSFFKFVGAITVFSLIIILIAAS